MRTTEQRRAKYGAKYDPSTVGLKYAAQLDNMTGYYTAYANEMVQKEIATQDYLNGLSTPPPRIDYPFYYAFSRELFHLVRTGYAGSTLATEAKNLCLKWKARGLTENTLKGIALTVYGIEWT